MTNSSSKRIQGFETGGKHPKVGITLAPGSTTGWAHEVGRREFSDRGSLGEQIASTAEQWGQIYIKPTVFVNGEEKKSTPDQSVCHIYIPPICKSPLHLIAHRPSWIFVVAKQIWKICRESSVFWDDNRKWNCRSMFWQQGGYCELFSRKKSESFLTRELQSIFEGKIDRDKIGENEQNIFRRKKTIASIPKTIGKLHITYVMGKRPIFCRDRIAAFAEKRGGWRQLKANTQ